ncbi:MULTISPECIES: aspartate-alanine antiporter [unclassified Ruegeria]|uniref:aspartate-alanine antiporter n=1 Tax=unclassified Ruegeria TaxID=2625375 RepID=UPI001AD99F99|nr:MULTISPECIES: aspartate-alanine antiporter [unclassified Ruegeria]MBO9412343.1 aspartate-alanine antiporter [Ruegeria sp. R8_1]MBO9416419.1 aspartate-alanine antiporter [Ruegeria sp. R8_2]
MDILAEQLRAFPIMALFLCLGLGYGIGKFRVGKFELGGIAGTLLVAVFVGQIGGITLSTDVQNVFFSLFIFMVGYNGGPQFFAALNRSALTKLLAAFMMTAWGLFFVIVVARMAGLDKGLAAGLAAGGLTQSAIIGTAGNAIDLLGLAADEAEKLKTNIAVGYSVTYIFGSIGPILAVSVIPIILRCDLRQEAIKLASKLSGGGRKLEEGEFLPMNRFEARAYRVTADAQLAGQSVKAIEERYGGDLIVEKLMQNGISVEPEPETVVGAGDVIVVSGLVASLTSFEDTASGEIGEYPPELVVVEERRNVIITNRKLTGKTLAELRAALTADQRRGVHISKITRMGHDVPVLHNTELHAGDEISIVGHKDDLNRVAKLAGYVPPSASATNFIALGVGVAIGYLIGEISFVIAGTKVALGSGLGCLVTGLIIGYLRIRRPKIGGINHGAANFLQSFGLAVFVGVVGLNAGKPALEAIQQYGITLLLLGVVVTLMPMIVQFTINYFILGIKNPVEACAVVTGSRSGNPGFATLLEKTGNATPTPAFTMTYAVANIFLTLWGPLVVAFVP